MIKIIIEELELEKIISQVETEHLPNLRCINYTINGIFIGTRLEESSTIEFLDHFESIIKVQEILDKYFIKYIKREI